MLNPKSNETRVEFMLSSITWSLVGYVIFIYLIYGSILTNPARVPAAGFVAPKSIVTVVPAVNRFPPIRIACAVFSPNSISSCDDDVELLVEGVVLFGVGSVGVVGGEGGVKRHLMYILLGS